MRLRATLGALAATGLATVGLLAGCTSSTQGKSDRSTSPPPGSSSSALSSDCAGAPPPSGGSAGCPASYIAPDPKRPAVRLQFTVGNDLSTVQGSEHVEFTPDLQIGRAHV